MTDTNSQTPTPPIPDCPPVTSLPVWLRDWRIFAILLLVMVLGGQGAGDVLRSLLGLPAGGGTQTCCQALEPRLVAIDSSLRRNDTAHERILIALGRRGILVPAGASGAVTPPPSIGATMSSSGGAQ